MPDWIQQGFIGPRQAVDAARAALAQDVCAGGILLAYSEPPREVVAEPDGFWSFGVVATQPVVTPCGLRVVNPSVANLTMAGSTS